MKEVRKRVYLQGVRYKRGFISLYALLLTLAISLVALHTMRTLAMQQDITLALYFQKQAQMYAKTLHDIALMCQKRYNAATCMRDFVQFDPQFFGEYVFHEEVVQDIGHANQGKKVLVLDIAIHAQTLLSTHPLRYAKRYIIKGMP